MSLTADQDEFSDPVELAQAMVEHMNECGSGFEGFVDDSCVRTQHVAFSCVKTKRRFAISVMRLRSAQDPAGQALTKMWLTPERRAAFAAAPRWEL